LYNSSIGNEIISMILQRSGETLKLLKLNFCLP